MSFLFKNSITEVLVNHWLDIMVEKSARLSFIRFMVELVMAASTLVFSDDVLLWRGFFRTVCFWTDGSPCPFANPVSPLASGLCLSRMLETRMSVLSSESGIVKSYLKQNFVYI